MALSTRREAALSTSLRRRGQTDLTVKRGHDPLIAVESAHEEIPRGAFELAGAGDNPLEGIHHAALRVGGIERLGQPHLPHRERTARRGVLERSDVAAERRRTGREQRALLASEVRRAPQPMIAVDLAEKTDRVARLALSGRLNLHEISVHRFAAR